jgi:hypothetical protein
MWIIILIEMVILTFQNVFAIFTAGRPSLFGATTESLLEAFAEGRNGALSRNGRW